MRNKNLKNKKAFSLIELSIVILIVGIIVAGVTQSSRLISAFKLSTARNLTQSSPFASMRNVVLWLETTSTASFLDSQSDNGITVTTWYDINPTSTTKYNTTGGPGALYTINCINSLPCLRFGGSSSTYFTYDGTFLANTDYTVILVEQRRASGSNYYMGSTTATGTNTNLHLGYVSNTADIFNQYGNDIYATVSGYSSPTPKVKIYRFNSSTGKNLYINGVDQTLITAGQNPTQGLVSYVNASIGSVTGNYYTGDFAEIIMFNRAITTEERDAIETYLGKKWNITVS